MTPDTLSAIRARADSVPTCELLVRSRDARTARAQVWMDDAGDLRFVADVNERWGPYADLFAASVTDIPTLVAYVRRLEGEKDAAREEGRRAGLEEAAAQCVRNANEVVTVPDAWAACRACADSINALAGAGSPMPGTTTEDPR